MAFWMGVLVGGWLGAMVGVLLTCAIASGAIADARLQRVRDDTEWAKSEFNPANYGPPRAA